MTIQVQPMKIGELLVAQSVLTREQVDQILVEQKLHGRPFGDLAERMFNVSPQDVENAWVEQYIGYGTQVDLEKEAVSPEALDYLNRRQAWQFRILPLYHDGEELVAATSRANLRRAVNFAWRKFHVPVYFLIAEPGQLEKFLMKHYSWPSAMMLPLPMAG